MNHTHRFFILLLLSSFFYLKCKDDDQLLLVPEQGLVNCYRAERIYKNTSQEEITILISAEDNCSFYASAIELNSREGDRISEDVLLDSLRINKFTVLPAGAEIVFNCQGKGSRPCDYFIIPESFTQVIKDTVVCGTINEVFWNNTQDTVSIKLSVTDSCPTFTSFLEVIDLLGNYLQRSAIDSIFINEVIAVPANAKVKLICNGEANNESYCSYDFTIE